MWHPILLAREIGAKVLQRHEVPIAISTEDSTSKNALSSALRDDIQRSTYLYNVTEEVDRYIVKSEM